MLAAMEFRAILPTKNAIIVPLTDSEVDAIFENELLRMEKAMYEELDAIFDAEVLKTENVKMAAKVRQIWEATLETCLSAGKK